jgi:hypothetical protein
MLLLAALAAGVSVVTAADGLTHTQLLAQLKSQKWVQIPGVEPILRPTDAGGGGSYIEMGDIIREFDEYFLYFHGLGIGGHPSYSIGAASAPRYAFQLRQGGGRCHFTRPHPRRH